MTYVDSVAETRGAVRCALAAEVLRSFGTLGFVATGWSMLPSVWPGETLVVKRVSKNKDKNQDHVRVGDVVLVGRDGRLCAHRVIALPNRSEDPRWITQGDAQPAPDPPVAASELLGRVAYVIRRGKQIALPAELSAVETLIARVVRRSLPAARALIYLNRLRQTSETSVLPCQG
ncbi:MAG TPA: S24/S26 family peptidase [Candidatus Deferrimicrobiaceae bacterium]|jgi:hypothetical protein|nr:S24/S26 family peptidase [Candidatus Deferrimicrobiaceae bacterium]